MKDNEEKRNEKEWKTKKQLAKELGISESQVSVLEKKGKLKVGKTTSGNKRYKEK